MCSYWLYKLDIYNKALLFCRIPTFTVECKNNKANFSFLPSLVWRMSHMPSLGHSKLMITIVIINEITVQQPHVFICMRRFCKRTVMGVCWKSRPDTSHAGGFRDPAPAQKRQHHRSAWTRQLCLDWHHCTPTHTQFATCCRIRHAINGRYTLRSRGLQRLLGDVHRAAKREKMKRKSERRRAEPRKKHCAAPNSSEVAPNSDIYIEITGKSRCEKNPANFVSTWQMRADALGGLRPPRPTFLNDQGVWMTIFLFPDLT